MNDTGTATIVGGGAPSATVKTAQEDVAAFATLGKALSQQAQQPAATQPAVSSGQVDTKAAARTFMEENRAAVAKGDDLALRQKYREASHHALADGPAPQWIAGASKTFVEQATEAAANSEAGTFDAAVAAQVAPIQEKDLAQLRTLASVKGLPSAEAARIADFCLAAELPESSARTLIERVARHWDNHGGEPLDAEGHAEYYAEACKRFGSIERLHAVNDQARAYLDSISPDLGRFVDEKLANSSLIYDPFVLRVLANAATRKGIK